MKQNTPNLGAIQHWMQAVIMNPDGVRAGVREANLKSPSELNSIIHSTGALTVIEALSIYNRGYQTRLLECFRSEFPVLLYALGDALFDWFALDYLKRHPSQTHSLFYLCESFPSYLTATRPDSELPAESRESWPEFIIDLAQLERSINEVYRGPGVEGSMTINSQQVEKVKECELAKLRFHFAPCIRAHFFHYPVSSYFHAVRKKLEPELPSPEANHVVINRNDFVVRTIEVTRSQYEFLTALMNGENICEASGYSSRFNDTTCRTPLTGWRSWISSWADAGFFISFA